MLGTFSTGDVDGFLARRTRNPTRWSGIGSMSMLIDILEDAQVELIDYRQMMLDDKGSAMISEACPSITRSPSSRECPGGRQWPGNRVRSQHPTWTMVLLCIEQQDSTDKAEWMAAKIANLRVFEDEQQFQSFHKGHRRFDTA